MKEPEAQDDAAPGTKAEPGPEGATTPEITDQEAQDPGEQVIEQTAQEETPAQEMAQTIETPTPPQSSGQSQKAPMPEMAGPAGTERDTAGPESPFVLLTSDERSRVIAAPAPQPTEERAPEQAHVHVAPNLLDLTTGRVETPTEKKEAREQHNLDHVVHNVLIVGLAISTILLLTGIVLEIIQKQGLPTVEPDFGQVFARVVELRPSGFLALGLLALIATPVLRVIGSIIAFAYERDWRFAGITFLVLMVLVLSTLLGKG